MTQAKSRKPKYDAETMYAVTVKRVVPGKGTTLRPKGKYMIKGKVLNGLSATDIRSAEPAN